MAATKKSEKKQAAAAPAAAVPPAAKSSRALAAPRKGHGFRRKMTGKVIKAKMMKTVVVECITSSRDALYGKYIRSRTRYKAHDETNQYKVGDIVSIEETRPISKDKTWTVVSSDSAAN
jgi:small subunit ribosomal protein S17